MDLASISQNVAVVEASAITVPLDRTRPVIIRGAAAALQRQWTTERILERFHGRRLKVAQHARSAASMHVMPLADYLAYLDAPDDGAFPPQYLMHGVDERLEAQELVSSLDIPDATELVGGVSFYRLYVGPQRTGSLPHNHKPAFNVLLQGRKRWALYIGDSSEQTEELVDESVRDYPHGSQIEPWFRDECPRLRERKGIAFYELVQQAGDTLYIPDQFLHAVMNLDRVLGLVIQ
jgi:hypothetical protein